MSRIGNNPVKLPPKVEVSIGAGEISIKGPLGTLSRHFGETVSVEKSEHLSSLLKKRGIKHEVLNAKHHEREASIVAGLQSLSFPSQISAWPG